VLSLLSERIQGIFKKLRSKGRLTPEDVDGALKDIRVALLEADVNFRVVKDLVNRIRERAVGQEILESLTPAQQVVKIVHEELTRLMGGGERGINWAPQPPTVVMMVGLQGSGKTTTAAKLAALWKKQGKRPLLVAADVYRPAAVKQLQVLGEQIGVPVFSWESQDPVEICRRSLEQNLPFPPNPVIIDTAGRLHIDVPLMEELKAIKEEIQPQEILLVVDAMTGQDAVEVAQRFHADLGLTGVVLTKMDGDARGGAALSVLAVTGCPIKFMGTGEKIGNIEIFHPDRLASRILGMGDVLTLIEKAQEHVELEKAKEWHKKIQQRDFTLEDFLEQLKQMKKMGPLEELLHLLPGLGPIKELKGVEVDPKEVVRMEAIIQSMTPEERRNPAIINSSRKKRIAAGSGTRIQDVNRLLRQFEETKKLLQVLTEGKGKKKKMKELPFPWI